jgi:hypothetical protein
MMMQSDTRRTLRRVAKRRPISATNKDLLLVHAALPLVLPKFGAEGMTARSHDS